MPRSDLRTPSWQQSWRRWERFSGDGVAEPGSVWQCCCFLPPAGMAFHYYGRACFVRAASELEALLGRELVFDFAHLERPLLPRHENAAEWLLDGVEALDVRDGERARIEEAWLLARQPPASPALICGRSSCGHRSKAICWAVPRPLRLEEATWR